MADYLNSLKSSGVKPAAARIFCSRPLPISIPVWTGMVTILRVIWFISVRWLPFCRSSLKPRFLRNRTGFLAVMAGSFAPMFAEYLYKFLQYARVSRPSPLSWSVLLVFPDALAGLRGCFFWPLQWSGRWKNTLADSGNRRNNLYPFILFQLPLQRSSISGGSYTLSIPAI